MVIGENNRKQHTSFKPDRMHCLSLRTCHIPL